MKKAIFFLVIMFIALFSGYAQQVITVPVATPGSFSDAGPTGTVVNKQFRISTGTNVCISLTITGYMNTPIFPYHGLLIFYNCDANFSNLVEISRSSNYALTSLNVASTVSNGKMVVAFTYDGCCGPYDFRASYLPTAATAANIFNTSGPVTLDAFSSVAPNLTITDYTNKTMGVISNTISDYTKSIMLMKSGTSQLGFGANKISANSNLGITSTGVLYQTASNLYFSTATIPNAFNILSNGSVGIGGTGMLAPIGKLGILQTSGANTEGIQLKYGTTNWYMYTNASNNLTLSQGAVGTGVTLNNTSGAILMSLGDYWAPGQTSLIFTTSAATGGYTSIQAVKAKTTEVGGILLLNPEGGNVCIGTTNIALDAKLAVNGRIMATEVKVMAVLGADFVFAPTYKLRPLSEVESFIKANQHLPDVAPATEMQTNGVNIGDMQSKLLQKVEELTLYTIELEKKVKKLNAMEAEMAAIKELLLKNNLIRK